MKVKQSAFIMLLFSILIFACACSKKQTRIQSNANVNIEKLTWNDNVEKYEMDTIKYLYKKSSDGIYLIQIIGAKTHQMLHTMCLEIRLWMAMIFNIRKQ